MSTPPIACSLSPTELRERQDGLIERLAASAEERQWFEDGLRLRFGGAADVVALLHQFVEAERRCCGFLRFRMSYEPACGPIELEIAGPEGTREYLETLFAPFSESGR